MATNEQLISLDQHLGLETLPELAKRFSTTLASGDSLALDGSAVRSIDGAAMQLLLAMLRTARKEGIPCRWQEVAPPLVDAAALLGVSDELLLAEAEQ